MTLNWTFISNELTRTSFCSKKGWRNFFNQAVLDPDVPKCRTGSWDICKKMADILRYSLRCGKVCL